MDFKKTLTEAFFEDETRFSENVGLAIDRLNEALLDERYDMAKVAAGLQDVVNAACEVSAQREDVSPAQCLFDNILLYKYGHAIVFGTETVSELLEPALAMAVERVLKEEDMEYSPDSPMEDVIEQGCAAIVTTVSIIDETLALHDSNDLEEFVDGFILLARSLAELQECDVAEVVEYALSTYAAFAEATDRTPNPALDEFVRTEALQRLKAK